jgi:hypothetical protein
MIFLSNRIFIITAILSSSCFFRVLSQTTYIKDDAIYVEVNKNNTHKDYNWDNKVYTKGRKFYFDYIYSKNGKNLFFDIDNNGNWFFSDTISKQTVKGIRITILEGLEPFIMFDSSYNQTVMRIDYLTLSGIPTNESTGIIENKKNIWLHPPRSLLFRILELNPFPFIQTPYKTGNKWQWQLDIGDTWGDSRWYEWKGIIKNQYQYEIVGKKNIKTTMGLLPCFVINAKAKSKLGETYLKSYFNNKYGFVKYEYTNIDKSKLLFKLTKIE